MENNELKQLVSYLSEFVTEQRWEKFQQTIENRTKHLTVVIEDVFQSHNISAVLRSCECFGVHDIHVIEKNNIFEINSEIELGASKWLDIQLYNEDKVNNTKNCIDQLKKKGYRVIATSPHRNDCNLDELDVTDKTALLFGKELEGLSDDAMGMADGYLKIPMYGFTESFNISVTVALCVHFLTKKMRESSVNWHLSEEEKLQILINWLKKSIKNSKMILDRYSYNNQLEH